MDLSKLRKTSLKRYKKHFNLDVKADSKTELLEAVGRHFATMPVREADVALDFYNFLRNLRGKRSTSSDPSSVELSPPAAAAAANAQTTPPVPVPVPGAPAQGVHAFASVSSGMR